MTKFFASAEKCLTLAALFVLVPLSLLLLWLFLLNPFAAFTFTDAIDFVPGGMIVGTLAALALRHWRRPYPPAWARLAIILLFSFAVLTPLFLYVPLHQMAEQAALLIGHWPQVMVNDPKLMGENDAVYQNLRNRCGYAFAFVGWGLWTQIALFLHLRHSLSSRQTRAFFIFSALAWLLFFFEPGHLFAWWMD